MDHSHVLTSKKTDNHHAFTASTALFSFAPEAPENLVRDARKGRDHTWQSPANQMQSLLTLCGQVVLDNEIAPVQMWQRIATALGSKQMPLEKVVDLQSTLADYVECRG